MSNKEKDQKVILELIMDNILEDRIVTGKRRRKQTNFFSKEKFVSGRYDQYDRSSCIHRNNWFGKKNENTILGKEEDCLYKDAKQREKGYSIDNFVVEDDEFSDEEESSYDESSDDEESRYEELSDE